MKVLAEARSTNGRWGLALVGPDEADATGNAWRGTVRSLGTAAGIETYLLVPDQQAQTWVLWAGDATAHGGATTVARMSLQSNDYAGLLLLGPQAVVEHHGYKRRGSSIRVYVDGVAQDAPAPVLLALGLLPSDGQVPADPAPPLALEGALARAFALARGARP